jgi:hypothetical protein
LSADLPVTTTDQRFPIGAGGLGKPSPVDENIAAAYKVNKRLTVRGANMSNGSARLCLGLLGLLCSSAIWASTVDIVPSNSHPKVGESFSLTVNCVEFPETFGATLNLSFNSAVVSVSSVELVPGSPFTSGVVAKLPLHSGDSFTVLGPETGSLPSGNFSGFRINFTALAPGKADIMLFEVRPGSWSDPKGQPIPATYKQAEIQVKGPAGQKKRSRQKPPAKAASGAAGG